MTSKLEEKQTDRITPAERMSPEKLRETCARLVHATVNSTENADAISTELLGHTIITLDAGVRALERIAETLENGSVVIRSH